MVMVKLGAAASVDEISFSDRQYSFDVGISKLEESLRCATEEKKQEIRKYFEEADAISKELDIRIGLPRLEQSKTRQHCKQLWTELVTGEKGHVRPCCAVHFVSFGDLNTQTVKEIWNDKPFTVFRERLLTEDTPEYCKNCIYL